MEMGGGEGGAEWALGSNGVLCDSDHRWMSVSNHLILYLCVVYTYELCASKIIKIFSILFSVYDLNDFITIGSQASL